MVSVAQAVIISDKATDSSDSDHRPEGSTVVRLELCVQILRLTCPHVHGLKKEEPRNAENRDTNRSNAAQSVLYTPHI